MSLQCAIIQMAFINTCKEKAGFSDKKNIVIIFVSFFFFIALGRLACKCCHPACWCLVRSTLQKQGPFTGATWVDSPSYKEVWLLLSFCLLICVQILYWSTAEQHVWGVGISETHVAFPVAGTPQYSLGFKEESDAPVLNLAKVCQTQDISQRSSRGWFLWWRSNSSYFSIERKYWLKVTILVYFQLGPV